MSKISEFCRSIVPAFIEEQVCNFPEWAADKLYAPIERKIEAKINQIQDDVYYKITHNAEFEAEESGKDWITNVFLENITKCTAGKIFEA